MLLTEFDEKLHKKTVYNEGYEDGHKNGVIEGFERGHKYGVSEGFDKARKNDIKHSIDMLRSMGISDDRIICLIAENYNISKEHIMQKMSALRDL